MMQFLSKNHKNYLLTERKWEMVGTETYQIGGTGINAGKTYSKNKFDWVDYDTKIHSSSYKFDRSPSLVINGKNDTIRGYLMSCRDTSDFSNYYGGINTEVKVANMSYYHYDEVCVRNMTNFIRRIPKNSRKRLVKMMYLYDLRTDKDIYAFDMLLLRLKKYFSLNLLTWGCEKGYQFDRIKPTFTTTSNRNRRINCIFRYARKLRNG